MVLSWILSVFTLGIYGIYIIYTNYKRSKRVQWRYGICYIRKKKELNTEIKKSIDENKKMSIKNYSIYKTNIRYII